MTMDANINYRKPSDVGRHPRAGKRGRAPPLRSRFAQEKDWTHRIIVALDKLDDAATREQGCTELRQICDDLADHEVEPFLKRFMDRKHPLRHILGLRDALLFLPYVCERHSEVCGNPLLLARILHYVTAGLMFTNLHGTVGRVVRGIWQALQAFYLFPHVVAVFLDYLRRGSSTPGVDKVGAMRVLQLLLQEVADYRDEGEIEQFASTLISLVRNRHELHSGLLMLCSQLVTMGKYEAEAEYLAELCIAHLSGHSALPPCVSHGLSRVPATLTRDLALSCCLLLGTLAKTFPNSCTSFRVHAEVALSRDNLDLMRLTRNNPQLRRAIHVASQEWVRLRPARSPSPHSPTRFSHRSDEELGSPRRNGGSLSRKTRPSRFPTPSVEDQKSHSVGPSEPCIEDNFHTETWEDDFVAGSDTRETNIHAQTDDFDTQSVLQEAPLDAGSQREMEMDMQESIATATQESILEIESKDVGIQSIQWHNKSFQDGSSQCRFTDNPNTTPRGSDVDDYQPAKVTRFSELIPLSPKCQTLFVRRVKKKSRIPTRTSMEATVKERGECTVPYLQSAMTYINDARLDLALECVFRLGNEETLVHVLSSVNACEARRLPAAAAEYLATLLLRIVLRESSRRLDTCREQLLTLTLSWMENLLSCTLVANAIVRTPETNRRWQGALFQLSGHSQVGAMATRLYYATENDVASQRR